MLYLQDFIKYIMKMKLLAPFLLVAIPLYCETSIEYENSLNDLIKTYDVSRNYRFSHTDSREYQDNKIDIFSLTSMLTENSSFNDNSIYIEPIQVDMNFIYFGFYRTESGTWIGKSIIQCSILDKYNTSYKKITTLTNEKVFKRKRSLKKSLFDKWSNELLHEVHKKITDYKESYTKSVNDNYRIVISFGKFEITDSEEDVLKFAELDALRNGCVNAWGCQLESTTTMIDLADVNEKTTSTTKGLVLGYNLLDKYTKVTDDNYLCIIIQSIILSPY